MNTRPLLVPVVGSLLLSLAAAQSGRTMRQLAPVVLGQVAAVAMEHPVASAGHPYALAMCSPSFAGSQPLAIPGVASGVLLLDPLSFGVLDTGLLDASGRSPSTSFVVPNNPLLVGATLDLQAVELDAFGVLILSDDELAIEVAAPPPASLNLVPIGAGSFAMGSGAIVAVEPATGNELPVHPVTITQPFWMGRFEVTQTEFAAVMGFNPSFQQGASYPAAANRPVEQVTWFEAVAYCDALSVQEAAAGRLPTGYEYRLPTEAEWEYACRAGTTSKWHVGASLDCGHANHASFAGYCVPHPVMLGQTSVVGSYPANAFGLHDMHGNVWEWCLDRWNGIAPYVAGAVADPLSTAGSERIVRGGAFDYGDTYCRSARRYASAPTAGSLRVGFRIVCAPVRD